MFGFDVIQSVVDCRLFVVDINYFPTYKNFPELPGAFQEFILHRVHSHATISNDRGTGSGGPS